MLGQKSGKKEVKKWLKNGKKVVSFSRNLVVKSLADTETKIKTDTTETSRPIENPNLDVPGGPLSCREPRVVAFFFG